MAIPAGVLLMVADAAKIIAAAAPLFEGRELSKQELKTLFDEVEASRLSRDQARVELREVIDQMPD